MVHPLGTWGSGDFGTERTRATRVDSDREADLGNADVVHPLTLDENLSTSAFGLTDVLLGKQ